ncbi:CDP-alcohol phosphatidyltransferase family protein [Roseimaritima sediminicola]|uniref:CDP-alcohol phosphatidyltransferase family protein n=1 Tax=Roseimaritima sediminicola TaxID=2662066 RepID=UPI001298276B|nr:CDP-alcohol phosphatidyltransferase family protein [Roseimaritima sediminicola]
MPEPTAASSATASTAAAPGIARPPDKQPPGKPPAVWVTVPNALCLVRFLGAFGLIALAILDRPMLVVALFLFLTATDWIDGKLAVWLDQRSRIGPKLDTLADVTMYACLLVATIWMFGDVLWQEAVLLALALGSYVVSCLYAWGKFGSAPAYHTRAAKTCWFLMVAAVFGLFFEWSVWPLRIALVGIVLTNIEAMLITRSLKEPRTDIRWLGDAWRSPPPVD